MDLSMLVGNPSKELILRERKAKHYNYDTALVGKLDSNAFKHAYSESRGRLFSKCLNFGHKIKGFTNEMWGCRSE